MHRIKVATTRLRLSDVNMLYIDAEPSHRAVVKDMLSVAGADMIEAQSTWEGLAVLEEMEVHLVLADLRVDGIGALCSLCSAKRVQSEVQVFAVATKTSPKLHDACVAAGAADLIVKPVVMDTLLTIIMNTKARRDAE